MITDAQLQTNVLEELGWRPGVDSACIGVTAKDGVVTLTGEVAHDAERSAAEDTAKGVCGVKGWVNDITVRMLGAQKRSDRDLEETALDSLKWNCEVPSDKLEVGVKDGRITLTGTLEWQYQKEAAARSVRNLKGVAAVSNDITITPP